MARPLKGYVHIKYTGRVNSSSLVYIPDFVEHQERIAEVVAVGRSCRYLKAGDKVMTFEGVEGESFEDFNVLEESHIMGIMDGELPVPYSNRVIVLPDAYPDEIGGIIIPEVAKHKVLVGTVTAAGDGKWYDDKFVANEVKAGDRVLYAKFSGGYDGFKIDGVKHLSMRDEDILMVLEE